MGITQECRHSTQNGPPEHQEAGKNLPHPVGRLSHGKWLPGGNLVLLQTHGDVRSLGCRVWLAALGHQTLPPWHLACCPLGTPREPRNPLRETGRCLRQPRYRVPEAAFQTQDLIRSQIWRRRCDPYRPQRHTDRENSEHPSQ